MGEDCGDCGTWENVCIGRKKYNAGGRRRGQSRVGRKEHIRIWCIVFLQTYGFI